LLRAPSNLTLNVSRDGHLPPLRATCARVSSPLKNPQSLQVYYHDVCGGRKGGYVNLFFENKKYHLKPLANETYWFHVDCCFVWMLTGLRKIILFVSKYSPQE